MTKNADGTHGTGPTNSDSVGDTTSGNGAVNPADMERMINEAVSKALGARMRRLNIEEMVTKAIEQHMPATQPKEIVATPASDEPATTVKALDSQTKAMYQQLKTELEAERKARADAEARASQTKLQSDLRAAFAKHMGDDNPHLGVYLDAKARDFQVRDGHTYRVTKDEFGDEQIIPLDKAAEDLFKGELKHLVPQRQANLPPTSLLRGMPLASAPVPGGGFLERTIVQGMAQRDPERAAEYKALLDAQFKK